MLIGRGGGLERLAQCLAHVPPGSGVSPGARETAAEGGVQPKDELSVRIGGEDSGAQRIAGSAVSVSRGPNVSPSPACLDA